MPWLACIVPYLGVCDRYQRRRRGELDSGLFFIVGVRLCSLPITFHLKPSVQILLAGPVLVKAGIGFVLGKERVQFRQAESKFTRWRAARGDALGFYPAAKRRLTYAQMFECNGCFHPLLRRLSLKDGGIVIAIFDHFGCAGCSAAE